MTEVDLYGMLSIGLDSMRDDVRAMRENASRVPPQPIERKLTNAAAFPASGLLALNFGGPQQGRKWQVRSVAAGGATPTTTAAGRSDLFVATAMAEVLVDPPASGSQPGAGGFIFASGLAASSMGAWRDESTTLPNIGFYGTDQLAVHAGEHLWLVLSSGTSTQLYVANVRVDDYETAAYPMGVRV